MFWQILGEVRKYKTVRGLSLAEPVAGLTITAPAGIIEKLDEARADILAAARAVEVTFRTGEELSTVIKA